MSIATFIPSRSKAVICEPRPQSKRSNLTHARRPPPCSLASRGCRPSPTPLQYPHTRSSFLEEPMTTKEINQTSRRKNAAARRVSDSPEASDAPKLQINNPLIKRRVAKPRPSGRGTEQDALASFHPAIAAWFRRRFQAPTDAQ